MVLSIISLYIFLSILRYNFFLLLNNSSIDNKNIFDEKIQNRVKLYLPEYQNKHIRLNELNNSNYNFSNIRNNRNTLLISDDIIETYDEAYKKQKISERINDQFLLNFNGKYKIKTWKTSRSSSNNAWHYGTRKTRRNDRRKFTYQRISFINLLKH